MRASGQDQAQIFTGKIIHSCNIFSFIACLICLVFTCRYCGIHLAWMCFCICYKHILHHLWTLQGWLLCKNALRNKLEVGLWGLSHWLHAQHKVFCRYCTWLHKYAIPGFILIQKILRLISLMFFFRNGYGLWILGLMDFIRVNFSHCYQILNWTQTRLTDQVELCFLQLLQHL